VAERLAVPVQTAVGVDVFWLTRIGSSEFDRANPDHHVAPVWRSRCSTRDCERLDPARARRVTIFDGRRGGSGSFLQYPFCQSFALDVTASKRNGDRRERSDLVDLN